MSRNADGSGERRGPPVRHAKWICLPTRCGTVRIEETDKARVGVQVRTVPHQTGRAGVLLSTLKGGVKPEGLNYADSRCDLQRKQEEQNSNDLLAVAIHNRYGTTLWILQ